LDQPVVLLLREHGSHVEHVLKHRLLKLPCARWIFCTASLTRSDSPLSANNASASSRFRFSNRREQFIPAPSEFGLNRLQIPFLFGAKTQLAVNPVMIIDRPCHGLAQEVIADIKSDRSDGAEEQDKKQERTRLSRLLVRIGQAQRWRLLGKDLQVQRTGNGTAVLAF
jgi:hypothetical protein